MEVNLLLRYLLAPNWWPLVQQQDYQFITGKIRITNADCHPNCSFRRRRARGDAEEPPYLSGQLSERSESRWRTTWQQFLKTLGRVSWKS